MRAIERKVYILLTKEQFNNPKIRKQSQWQSQLQ